MQAHYAARLRQQPAGFAAPFPYCDFVRPVFEELMAEARVNGERGLAGSSGVGCEPCGGSKPGAGCESPAGVGEARVGVGEADYALFDCI